MVVGVTAFGFGRVVAVVDVDAGRVVVVVVVGFGRVVVVVDVDVVVVGGGLTVSTRRKSTPQALPATKRRTGSTVHRDRRWRWGLGAVMSTGQGSGCRAESGGPRGRPGPGGPGVSPRKRSPAKAATRPAPS